MAMAMAIQPIQHHHLPHTPVPLNFHSRRKSLVPQAVSRMADSLGKCDLMAGWRLRLIGPSFSLEVVQQPIRARMCGFGDKVRCSGLTQLCAP